MKPNIKFFVTLILLPLLLHCGNAPEETEIKVFTYYNGNATTPHIDLFNTSVGTVLTSQTGITFETSYINGTNEIVEAKKILDSGTLPDVIYGHETITTFIENSALIPLNDLIENYGPNIKKYYGNLLNLFKNDTGIIYFIGENHRKPNSMYPQRGFWISSEVLKQAGWPRIKTLDQYVSVLKEYMQTSSRAGQKGLTFYTGNWESGTFITPAALLMGYPDHGDVYITNTQTMKTELIVMSQFGKKYFKLLNNLWNENLLDHEIFTQTYNRYKDKLLNNKAMGTFDHLENIHKTVLIPGEARGILEKQMIPFGLLYEEGSKEYYNTTPSIPDYVGVGISVQCTEPAEIIKFWNRFLEEDIQKMVYWGFNKTSYYNVKDEMRMTPEQFRRLYIPEIGTLRFIDGYPQRDQLSSYSDGNPITPLFLPNYTKSIMRKYLRNIFDIYQIPSFNAFFSPPEKILTGTGQVQFIPKYHPANGVKAKIDSITRKYLELCITQPADEFDDYWNRMQNELSSLAIKAYLDYRTDLFIKREKKLSTPYTLY